MESGSYPKDTICIKGKMLFDRAKALSAKADDRWDI